MATAKKSKDVILVNCQEVPETICVETRFITQPNKQLSADQIFVPSIELNKDEQFLCGNSDAFAVGINPTLVSAMSNSGINATLQQCQFSQVQAANSFLPVVAPLEKVSNDNTFKSLRVEMSNAVFGTPSTPNISNVVRSSEQTQQTDISAFSPKSIAIQCKLDDEIEDMDDDCQVMSNEFCENSEDTENAMESFLKFIKDNSTQHKTYRECLICGELCKSNKYFYGHMAVHRGPMALCSKCGKCLEHENLLHQHKCQKDKQLAKAFLKCPNFSCDVTAISPLELYDHINEHVNCHAYKCSACCKSFCTGQEFLRHILIRAKCYTSDQKKSFRLYGLETQVDRQCRVRVFTLHTYKKCTVLVKTFLTQRAQKKGVCKICFKSIGNKFLYRRHRLRCTAAFKKRLQKRIKNKTSN